MPAAAPEADTGSRGTLVLLSVGLGTFMTALDSSVVNAILPVMRASLGAGIDTIQWVVTAYLLVIAGLLLTFGRLGDMKGHRRVYLSGFRFFLAGSVLCGAAPDERWLIAARILQAFGGAMLLANSPAILTAAFPPSQRGRALGLQATMTYLGLTAGPALGGWLAQRWGWSLVFYINVPVGAAALLLARRFIPADPGNPHGNERFDLPGAALFLAGLSSILLALNQAHAWGWTSAATLLLLAAGAALLAGFAHLERRTKAPMLDPALFRSRLFSVSVAAAIANYVCLFSVVFLLPFHLIQGRGFPPSRAGLLLVVQSIVMAVVAPLSGIVSDRAGSRIPGTVGMALLGAGLLLLSRLDGGSPAWQVGLSLAVTGTGTGIFISPNNSALMGSAPRGRQGIAAAVLGTARYVGMAMGVGISGAVLTTILGHGDGGRTPDRLFAAVSAGFVVAGAFAVFGGILSWLYGAEAPVNAGRPHRD